MKHVGLILIALVLSSACYLYGLFHHVPENTYTGSRSINASDYNQHLSWIGQCREGHFLLKNLYTTEPHRGALVRPVYFVLSLPFAVIPVSNSFAFHILRVLCGLVLLLLIMPLMKAYEKDAATIRVAFLLLVFTSGAGFFLRRWIPNSADLGIPEAILFVSLGEAPHFLYSLLFLWSAITSFYLVTRGNYAALLIYFLSLCLIWWEHPFEAVVVITVCFANIWQISNWRNRILIVGGTAILSIPPYLYYQQLTTIPAFSGWGSAQNLMLSPSLPAMISAFLPLLILSIPAVLMLRHQPGHRKLLYFLVTWILGQWILSYAPLPFQRRLIAGVQFPLSLLGSYALARIRKSALIAAVILLACGSNVWLMTQQIKDISTGQMPYYLPNSYRDAFDWLSEQKEKRAILSGFVTGNFIPAYTGFATYVGHSSLTPEVVAKRRFLMNFYRHPDPEFLKKNGIQYIFWGLEERRFSSYPLDKMFRVAYDKNGLKILSVTPAGSEILWAKSL